MFRFNSKDDVVIGHAKKVVFTVSMKQRHRSLICERIQHVCSMGKVIF